MRAGKFLVTCDREFEAVIRGCATADDRQDGTWLTPLMIAAYCQLHELGHAHSIEVWCQVPIPPKEGPDEGAASLAPYPSTLPAHGGLQLVGGLYGVAIGGLFAAESKFHRVRDASKVALAKLVAHLRTRGYQLLDIQQLTPHTASLGAIELSRNAYLRRLVEAVELPVTFGEEFASDL
jgi:leucyl/phenylalanyl-tRNA--protein transferase